MRQCKSQAVQEEWHLHWGDPCLHFQSRGKNTQGKQWRSRDFPGGPLVENLPSNSGGVDSIFGRGTCSGAAKSKHHHKRSLPATARESPHATGKTQCSQKIKKSGEAEKEHGILGAGDPERKKNKLWLGRHPGKRAGRPPRRSSRAEAITKGPAGV